MPPSGRPTAYSPQGRERTILARMAAPASRARFTPLEYRDPAPVPWLISVLGVINRHLVLGGLLRFRGVVLPEADRARLVAAVNRDTVAFLGPAHPEFLTDWMIDKELSCIASPLMAHWASYEIVNATPAVRAFWLANNLIANVPGGGGKAYSVRWALAGHGVLLHPEGTATWQGERVTTLLPGLVDMAWEAAATLASRAETRPVHMVPLVWRLVFTSNAHAALARDVADLARRVGVTVPHGDLASSFAGLMPALLAQQCQRLGLEAPRARERHDYFAAQASVIRQLRATLAERYGALDEDLTRAQFQLRKAMRERTAHDPAGVRADRAMLFELQRLANFDPALYDREHLDQERIAEVLKRMRGTLLTTRTGDVLRNTLPVAVAPRRVHVRVAEPIAVHTAFAMCAPGQEDSTRAALLSLHRERLQSALDALGAELAAETRPHAIPNPLWSGGARA